MPSVPICCRTQPYTPREQVTVHIKIQCLSLLLIHISIQSGQTHFLPSPPSPAPYIHIHILSHALICYIPITYSCPSSFRQWLILIRAGDGRGKFTTVTHGSFMEVTHDNRLNSSSFQIFLRLETK